MNPSYGTLNDFRRFLRESHARGIRVITELVLNHTSDQHPWFQRSRRAAPGSSERDFYVWSETPDKFAGARIIFKDFETSNWTWDPLAKAYFWHRFYAHQPDLNYDNPAVERAMFKVIDFWLGMGVDGLRLDAVPYLFKREGTSSENLPETHLFLKKLRHHVDDHFPGRMLLAEANQWPEDAASYFGSGRGDECHTAFHFPLMPRLFMATRTERRYPIVEILQQTPNIPETAQWLLFLRNHDELTLEMVSDEERDYMYRGYAVDSRMRLNMGIRRRLAPLLNNDRRLIELMNGLLFSLPGTPVLYYGDEIGMGDNIYLGDRNGVRTPMQWSGDRNAGFSRANPQRLQLPVIIDPEYHYEAINVEAQQGNPRSLLWHMKRLIALRKQAAILGRASLRMLYPDNPRVFAFVRELGTQRIMVIANLSHLVQPAELDLREYRGARPVELLGLADFPTIGDAPYRFTLGPYDYFWFRLIMPIATPTGPFPTVAPVLASEGSWAALETSEGRQELEAILPLSLPTRRWFRAKAQVIREIRVQSLVPLARDPSAPHLAFIDVEFRDGEPQQYVIPLAFAEGARALEVRQTQPESVLATFRSKGADTERVLYDAAQDKDFVRTVIEQIRHNRTMRSNGDELSGSRTSQFDLPETVLSAELRVTPMKAEQSNTSARIGDRFILKLYRATGRGTNPELEIGLFFLRQEAQVPVSAVAGYLDLVSGEREPETVAILHRWVQNEGDAWTMTLDQLHFFNDRVRALLAAGQKLPREPPKRFELSFTDPPTEAGDLIGSYLEAARLLGVRTAQLHKILASDSSDPAFAPEPFDQLYVRSIYQTWQSYRSQVFELLRDRKAGLPASTQTIADAVLKREKEVDTVYRSLLGRSFVSKRIRIHGDYHLGQVLWTGKDFVIIDFEGEPLRPLTERRIKRNALRDVGGMIRSFDYAAQAARRAIVETGGTPEQAASLATAGRLWLTWTSAAFLSAYRRETEGVPFIPKDEEQFRTLLSAYVLEKNIYELLYELNNRPTWVDVPLQGLQYLLGLPE